ncbi:unnamed protein product [Danaus chrysippus]|uniref:(African queen) hypothetical protein n=1 Tax=Danaus chrysippus TaxID=151541 RepID=A0A8J2R8U6_9NEOP|nr:unnamed protein product [Danaus chrysippus]
MLGPLTWRRVKDDRGRAGGEGRGEGRGEEESCCYTGIIKTVAAGAENVGSERDSEVCCNGTLKASGLWMWTCVMKGMRGQRPPAACPNDILTAQKYD